MTSTNVGQILAEMRQHVLNLQQRERVADSALSKSQIVNEKITGMKEYQEEVANMNGCWRMQSRKALVADLQRENRQILQLQLENRELRWILEEYENALHIIMEKHRKIVLAYAHKITAENKGNLKKLSADYSVGNDKENLHAKQWLFLRLLDQCFLKGENSSLREIELIAKLTTENACLRELLNISSKNNPTVLSEFSTLTKPDKVETLNRSVWSEPESDEERDGASTPRSASQSDWADSSLERNYSLPEKFEKMVVNTKSQNLLKKKIEE